MTQGSQQPRRVCPPQLVLPNTQDAPAGFPQHPVYQRIATFVCGKLLLPEGVIVFRLGCMLRAAMPETTIHEDRQPEFGEDEIGLSEDGLVPPPTRDVMPPE